MMPIPVTPFQNDMMLPKGYAASAPVASQMVNDMNHHHQVAPQLNSTPNMAPRSASEAIFDSSAKFRQLPCRTFISVGTCPYRERCVYLHDPRCICREAKTKTRRKNKEDTVLDSLFWPIMPYPVVASKLDANRQPHVIQSYDVPPPQNDEFHRHDRAVHSMWMHFVDCCLAISESINFPYPDKAPCFAAPDLPMNSYTNQPRLPVFRVLSSDRHRGLKEIPREEFLQATMTTAVAPVVPAMDSHHHRTLPPVPTSSLTPAAPVERVYEAHPPTMVHPMQVTPPRSNHNQVLFRPLIPPIAPLLVPTTSSSATARPTYNNAGGHHHHHHDDDSEVELSHHYSHPMMLSQPKKEDYDAHLRNSPDTPSSLWRPTPTNPLAREKAFPLLPVSRHAM